MPGRKSDGGELLDWRYYGEERMIDAEVWGKVWSGLESLDEDSLVHFISHLFIILRSVAPAICISLIALQFQGSRSRISTPHFILSRPRKICIYPISFLGKAAVKGSYWDRQSMLPPLKVLPLNSAIWAFNYHRVTPHKGVVNFQSGYELVNGFITAVCGYGQDKWHCGCQSNGFWSTYLVEACNLLHMLCYL